MVKFDRATSDAWLVIFITAPLAVLGFSYAADAILGGRSLTIPGSPSRGIERFAVITVVFCAAELLFGGFFLLRRRRVVAAAGLMLYLLVLAFVAMLFGSFRT